jgi:Co/Zn/Cd efflux system component
MDAPLVEEVREIIATLPAPTKMTDLHLWRVGKEKYACIVSLAAADDIRPEDIRKLLGFHEELAHITVEINPRGRED